MERCRHCNKPVNMLKQTKLINPKENRHEQDINTDRPAFEH